MVEVDKAFGCVSVLVGKRHKVTVKRQGPGHQHVRHVVDR